MSDLNLSEQQQIVHAADKWRHAIHDEHIGDLFAVVEQIVARHVAEARAAALNEAAERIESSVVGMEHDGWTPHSYATNCGKCGRERAAEIVRNLAATSPP